MGICKDDSTTYLKTLGYNVVRHPQEGIGPLDLIGRQRGTTGYLGSLDQLVDVASSGPLPQVESLVATDVNGQKSSKFSLSLGANILGSILGAMGGELGVETAYTNARSVQFHFTDVTKYRATPLTVGNYLRDARVDAGNKVLEQYVLGNGQLFLILEVVKTKNLVVRYEREDGVDAKVDVPAIQQLLGANVTVSASAASKATISYVGPKELTFGFRCYEVGVAGGVLTIMASKTGAVPLAAGADSDQAHAEEAALLVPEGVGLLSLEDALGR